MSIQAVKSFQTSDKKLHPNRVEALKHEYGIELRGLIQSGVSNPSGHYTIDQLVNLLKNQGNLIIKRMAINQKMINRAAGQMKKTEKVV